MKKDLRSPKVGTTCPALTNENYKYHLSGECGSYCICSLNNNQCLGVVIEDPDYRSSHFFSRAKCLISDSEIKKCPAYGMSIEGFAIIVKEKAQRELEAKLRNISA